MVKWKEWLEERHFGGMDVPGMEYQPCPRGKRPSRRLIDMERNAIRVSLKRKGETVEELGKRVGVKSSIIKKAITRGSIFLQAEAIDRIMEGVRP